MRIFSPKNWGPAVVPGVVVSMFLLGACQPAVEKEEGRVETPGESEMAVITTPAGEDPVVKEDPPAAPEPVVVRWSPEQAGFAKHLPADTAWYLEVKHLAQVWEWMEQFEDHEVTDKVKEALESPEKIAEAAKAAGVEGLDDVPLEKLEELREDYAEEGMKALRALFGEEVFVGMRGLEWMTDPLVFYQEDVYPEMISRLVEAMANGDFDADDAEEWLEGLFAPLGADMRERLDKVDGKPVLGIQMGGLVSEERSEIMDILRKWMELGAEESEELTAHSFEKGGVTWTGWKMTGPSDWTESEDFEELKQSLGEDNWKAIAKMVLEMELVVAWGEVGDYVVLYAGLGEHSLEVPAGVEQSLAGRAELQFLGEYGVDSLLGMYWVEKGLVDAMHRSESWKPLWDGIADGLAKSTKFGSAPLMAESVKKIAALTTLREAGKAHASAGALILDEGLRLEMRGGWQGVALDLASPLELAGAMHDRDDAMLLRAHWKKSKAYSDQGAQQVEEFVKIARLIGSEIQTAMEKDLEDLEDEEEEDPEERLRKERLAELYRNEFVKSVEDFWTGYRDHFKDAVGGERAIMVDLAGQAPPIAGLSEDVVEKGRIPRMAYVRPVENREELKKTWELWRGSGVRLLGMLSEAVETPIPFPDTLSADKDDLRTHFFSMPFATDDFLPCLSVSDELFMLGTSKAFSEAIYETLVKDPAKGEAPTGVIVEMDAGALWDFCEAWLEVQVDKNKLGEELDEDLPDDMEEPDVSVDPKVEEELRDAGLLDAEPDDPERGEDEAGLEAMEEMAADDFEDDQVVPDAAAELMEKLGLQDQSTWIDIARQAIQQARWFKGASYRKWLEDGVPRSSMQLHWGDPMAVGE